MAFPQSPTNGQQANVGGVTYTYSSAAGAWQVNTAFANAFVTISVTGNVNSGNLLNSGLISATGNITASYLLGNASALTYTTGAATGTYGNSTYIPVITVDSNHRITGISTTAAAGGGGAVGLSPFLLMGA